MLLLARENIDERQAELARSLTRQITNWPEFLSYAAQNRGLGFFFNHLSSMPGGLLPEGLLSEMRATVRRSAAKQMAVTTSMRRFHADCIAPVGAQHAYVKGPSLAAQFYNQSILRPCSDVDILVSKADFARVARAALARGDRLLFPSDSPHIATKAAELDFMIRHSDVIMSFDESGTLFEIHKHLEKSTPIFSERRLLREATNVRVGDADVRVLSTAWHFVYACYHHSRHFWSRLHWVSDLHAMQSHHSFDREEVLDLAKSIGLLATIEAALEFADLTDKPETWNSVLGLTRGGIFLDACLRGLPGNSAFELEGWENMFLFDFANPWQYDRGRKYVMWARSALRRLEPGCHQYAKRPRPRHLEWLYTFDNLLALSGNLSKRAGFR